MRSAAGLLAAVVVMATVATTLTALVPIYSTSIVDAGFQKTIADAGAEERTIAMTVRAESASWQDIGGAARATADDLLAGASDAAVFAETGSYRVGVDAAGTPIIASLAAVEGDELFAVTEQAAPTGAADLAASVHEASAELLGVGVGDVVQLERSAGPAVTVEITGLIEPVDISDPRWFGLPFGRDGVTTVGSSTEVGPFFVDGDVFAELPETVTIVGRFALDAEAISVEDIDRVTAGAESAAVEFAGTLGRDDVRVAGSLAALLGETDTALRSTGAVVGVILLQLVAVALYGLGVATAVLGAARRTETTILRSRGASTRQLTIAAVVEAAIVVTPAALLGPWLAARAVDAIGRWGPIESTGLELRGDVTTPAIAAAIGVAAIAVAVVTLTTRAAGRAADPTADPADSWFHRSGLDLVLLVLAILGLWQLARTGSVANSSTPDGRATIDPVLALAPTLGVIAASLLALRLVRAVARLVLRSGTRSPALVPALAGWDSVRRPAKQARTTVLIVVAVTIGVFAAVHSVSWQRSQRDQADAATGADITVVPDGRPAADVPVERIAGAYRSVDGVDAVMPIDVRTLDLGSELTSVTLVGVEVEELPAIDRLRSDLQPDPDRLAALSGPLDTGGVELEGAGEITASVTVDVVPSTEQERFDELDITLVVADEFGVVDRYPAQTSVAAPGVPATITFGALPLRPGGVDAPTLVGVELTGPVRVLEVGADRSTAPPPLQFDVGIGDLAVGGTAADISGVTLRMRDATRDGSTTSAGTASVRPSEDGTSISFWTGTNRRPNMRSTVRMTTAAIREGAINQDELTFDVLARPELLGRAQLAVGDEASVRIGGLRARVRIAGTVPVVPFAIDEPFALLADQRTLATVEYTTLGTTRRPDRWAIATGEDAHASVAGSLDVAPFNSVAVIDRRLEAEQRTADPVLIGLAGSLLAAVVAAAIVAILGLALTAVTEARERRAAYAVLRALGADRSELRRWLVRETVPLAALSVLAGVLAGVVLANLTVASLTNDRDGSPAIPEAELLVPWPAVGVLVVVVLVAVIALPLLTSRLLAGVRPADELRIGAAP